MRFLVFLMAFLPCLLHGQKFQKPETYTNQVFTYLILLYTRS